MPTATDGTDAEIIALVDVIMAGSQETDQLCDLAEAAENQQEKDRIRAAIQEQVSQGWDMRARLAGLHATTLSGWRAKARIVRLFNNCSDADGDVDGYDCDAVAWSLANDLLADAVHAP